MSSEIAAGSVSLILYSTTACHLCEQAEGILLRALPADRYSLTKKDIVSDEALLERYGHSIPVLVKITQSGVDNELFWPFDENKVATFLAI